MPRYSLLVAMLLASLSCRCLLIVTRDNYLHLTSGAQMSAKGCHPLRISHRARPPASIDSDAETINSRRVRVRLHSETANAHVVTLHAVSRLSGRGAARHYSSCLQPPIPVENDNGHSGR